MTDTTTPHPESEALVTDASFSVTACRGQGACPFGLVALAPLKAAIEAALCESGWDRHLRRQHPRGIRSHHRLRLALAACPNACSHPQVHDIGLIAAARPAGVAAACTACGLCERACREAAIAVRGGRAAIHADACLACGACARACPADAILVAPTGFRLLLGGHMGRHPGWASELPATLPAERLPNVVGRIVRRLIAEARPGERVWQTLSRMDMTALGVLDG